MPEPGPFLGASVLLLAAYFLSGAIWGRLVADLGGPRLPVATAVRLFMIANLGRYVPGKVWQIAGLVALGRGRGVPPAVGTGAAVLGQGLALVAATGIGTLALVTPTGPYRPWGLAGLSVVAVVVVLSAVPTTFRTLAAGWFRLAKTETPERLGDVNGLVWIGLYAGNWTLYALAFWILCASLGLEGALLPVASAFAAAYVLGYLMIFAPAGLGPREGFLTALLAPHFGVPASGLVAIVARLWTTAVELVPAGLFWAWHVSRSPDPVADRATPGGVERSAAATPEGGEVP